MGGFATLAEEIEHKFKTAYELARSNQALANFKMVLDGDKRKHLPTFKIGAKVWLYVTPRTNKKQGIHKKLRFPWQGLYLVVRQVTPNILELKLVAGGHVKQQVHINQVKAFHEQRPEEEPALIEDDDFDYEQERVIDRTTLGKGERAPENEEKVMKIASYQIKKGGLLEYEVCWEGGDKSWVLHGDVEKCAALDAFFNSRRHEPLFGLQIKLKWLEYLFMRTKYNYKSVKEQLEEVLREFLTAGVDLEKLIDDVKGLYTIGEVRNFVSDFVLNFKKRTRTELAVRGFSRATKRKDDEEDALEFEDEKDNRKEKEDSSSDEEEEDELTARGEEILEVRQALPSWVRESMELYERVDWNKQDWMFDLKEEREMKRRKI